MFGVFSSAKQGSVKDAPTHYHATAYMYREIEGAVDPSVGAKRGMHEISHLSLDNTGTFINCEDGLPIPW